MISSPIDCTAVKGKKKREGEHGVHLKISSV